MHNVAFTYAILAGASMAAYIIGLRLASPGTQPAVDEGRWRADRFSMKSVYFLVVVGVATACVNLSRCWPMPAVSG